MESPPPLPHESPVRTLRRGLSPSRADDFGSCPLKFRYRVIDRLPEPASATATRGTVVHEVLERLFDVAAESRTLATAVALLPEAWASVKESDPRVLDLFADPAEETLWLESSVALLEAYFGLEDPRRLEPAEREVKVELPLDSGLRLTGILDRLDVAPDGRIRIVDYKTGKAPAERYQDKALAQMKFYALVIWRLRGVVPTVLTLYYLGDRTSLSYTPTQADLRLTEKRLEALWTAIEQAVTAGAFVPKPGPLCRFCAHQAHCPEYGGQILPFPEVRLV